MALFKCKMCGGDLQVSPGVTVAECEYCGTQQTLPRLDDDRKANLYDRANHFRRNNDFDKAMGIYEQLLNEDGTDAEAYWSLVLCRYGIEYVSDPKTRKRIPTVNRAQFTSVFDDDNYKSALQYADLAQRQIYEAEAKAINEIQKGILTISQREEPFDVFICYKETDNNGRRTPDSVLAAELYHQLVREGFKVFFSRITLEDKLGTAYEPYIFAALNSAKVMVVLGTRPEYFQAVWVKNEWSRYLSLIRQGQQKILIPAYRDMDPYDLPEEFSHLQAQDMSKLGFMQDLLYGIRKLVRAAAPQSAVVKETVIAGGGVNTEALLKRVFMFLEDGDWNSANEYCEKVLDIDPECAKAYLGKLMAQQKVKHPEALKECEKPFDDQNHYQKALRFGDEKLRMELAGYISHINTRNENARLEKLYRTAVGMMQSAKTEQEYIRAAYQFEQIGHYKDAAKQMKMCREWAEEIKKNQIYNDACAVLRNAQQRRGKQTDIKFYEKAITLFQSLNGWKDADAQIEVCKQKIQQITDQKEAVRQENDRHAELVRLNKERRAERPQQKPKRKTGRNIMIVATTAVCVVAIAAFAVIWHAVSLPNGKYNDAIALMEAGKYTEAITVFEAMDGYKDSQKKIEECNIAILDVQYSDAVALIDAGKYREAAMAFASLGEYSDAKAQMKALWDKIATKQTIAAGWAHTVGIKADGTIVAVGRADSGQCDVTGWQDIISVAAGGNHTAGLKSDGTVVAMGDNEAGQCDVTDWQDVISVAAGNDHTVGLMIDSTVVAVGDNSKGQCNVTDWQDIMSVAAGSSHTVALKSDGTVVAVGDNSNGQCDVSDWQDIIAIAAGALHTVGLKSDGTVVAVGSSYDGQCDVSDWQDIVAIAAGGYHTVGLKSDSTVVVVGYTDLGQGNMFGWLNVAAVAAGGYHTVGLKADGTVMAVGDPRYGQCNVNDWTDIKVPE